MTKEKGMKVGVIGYVGDGKTAAMAFEQIARKNKSKTIEQIIEEEKSIKITATPEIPLIQYHFPSGQQNRRERRKNQRKKK
jgi:hypothetical protein